MIRKRKWAAYLLLAAVILAWVASSGKKDMYHREFGAETLLRFFQDTLSADENSGYNGILAQTPAVSLPPGDYLVTMNYESDTNENTFYLYTEDEGFSNEEGILLYEPACREVPVHLEKPGKNLSVCLYYNGTGYLHIRNVVIESTEPVCTDRFAIGATALLLLAVWAFLDLDGYVWLRKRAALCRPHGGPADQSGPANRGGAEAEKMDAASASRKKTYLWILALGLFVTVPFFNGFLIKGHDMSFHLNRIEQIYLGLLDGQFPVRLQPEAFLGYGYASPLLYPELFLYMPALLRAAGVSMVTSVGIFLLAVNLATAGIMYFCARRMFADRFPALVCSLLYACSMYRLVNQCTRFAIGELLAMAFMPLVLYGLYEIFLGSRRRWPWLTAGICGVLQSHVISTVFAVMIAGLFCLIFLKKLWEKGRLSALLKGVLWSALLNLWFLVPFLDMFRRDLNTGSLQLQFPNAALSAGQVLQMFSWSQGTTGFAGQGLGGKMSLGLGIGLLFFSACFLYGMAVEKEQKQEPVPVFCLGMGVLFALLSTRWFPWETVFSSPFLAKVFSFFQFPWRFLSCASMFLAFSAGAGARWLRERYGNTPAVFLAAVILCLLPAGYYMDDVNRGELYLMRMELADWDDIAGGEYLYCGTQQQTLREREPLPLSEAPGFELMSYEKQGTHIRMSYRLDNADAAALELPLLYYPGYEAVLQAEDGTQQRLIPGKSEAQLLSVSVTPGSGVLTVSYVGRRIWRRSFSISLAGLVCFAVLLWFERKYGGLSAMAGRKRNIKS